MSEEEVQLLEVQVERLQAEVAALQQQNQQNQQNQWNLQNQQNVALQLSGLEQDAMGGLRGPAGGVKEEVEELEQELQQQTQINGISLSSCSTKTLLSSGPRLVQQLCVSGSCSDLVFEVELMLSEVKEDAQRSARTITDLNVIMDSRDLHNFSSFLTLLTPLSVCSGVEESRDLLLFFRTLRNFSDRCEDRRRTFQHLQDKYPSVVSLPGGSRSEVMTLSHPELPSCVWFIHWSVDVSRVGGVTPKIDLLSKIPESALQLFPSPPAGGAAEAFQSLLRTLGPEAAMESLIMSVMEQ
ncbi:uncharacterized protein V6R79_015319 [Siganus canaliculatus]